MKVMSKVPDPDELLLFFYFTKNNYLFFFKSFDEGTFAQALIKQNEIEVPHLFFF